MNRTDRLLAIVLELQAKGWQRAEDLAARFEISKRTVYRDMQALSESGVPVISLPGQGYSLVEGYFLPPLTFSADEALILILGGDFMAQSFDAEYRRAAQSAVSKIEAVLSDQLREDVHYLQSSLRFVGDTAADASGTLQTIRRAVVQRRTVRFDYHARAGEDIAGTHSTRDANPYALVNANHRWYMIAYCHLRKDVRGFRIDRMSHVEVLRRAFARPAGYSLQNNELSPRDVTVRALFSPDVAAWVQEDRLFYIDSMVMQDDGLLVTLKLRREEDAVQWLLGWGAHVSILEPMTLRDRLIAEAQRMIDHYKSG
ncbi:MAG: WYL domain-containing protein [Chloroflexi bacterium]|nr:WYL domain-containing protein [Chloroflexota bacterium]